MPRHVKSDQSTGCWCGDCLPDWAAIWTGCARRLRAWRVPPRWSAGDWWEEVQAQGVAAAWQAIGDYDPVRGVPLSAFVRQRVMASARTRYRQEWSYALHCLSEAESGGNGTRGELSQTLVHESLRSNLARLAEPDHWLIRCLYWDGRTEAEVAEVLGISQAAVSKRKRAILEELRHLLEPSEKN